MNISVYQCHESKNSECYQNCMFIIQLENCMLLPSLWILHVSCHYPPWFGSHTHHFAQMFLLASTLLKAFLVLGSHEEEHYTLLPLKVHCQHHHNHSAFWLSIQASYFWSCQIMAEKEGLDLVLRSVSNLLPGWSLCHIFLVPAIILLPSPSARPTAGIT